MRLQDAEKILDSADELGKDVKLCKSFQVGKNDYVIAVIGEKWAVIECIIHAGFTAPGFRQKAEGKKTAFF